MKYFLIAGEASGDLHGARIVAQLKLKDPDAFIIGWGGDKMEVSGMLLLKHFRDLAFMGFVEVIANIRTILSNIKLCKRQVLDFKPDALIFIDYPGFNLRIAQWAKKQGFNTFYYISPQLWAWKESRVKHIKSSVDQLYTILPFENAFYAKFNVNPEFVGHPLLEQIAAFKQEDAFKESFVNRKVIALLPGSRLQEIKKILPIFLQAAKEFLHTPVIAMAPSVAKEVYQEIIQKAKLKIDPVLVQNKTYDLLSIAEMAWVSSGTATLETGLFKVPQIVCYTGNKISYEIAKRLIKIKYISLVNLILDKPLLKELIQNEFTVDNLVKHTLAIDKENLKKEYLKLNELLLPSNASERVALSIISKLKAIIQ